MKAIGTVQFPVHTRKGQKWGEDFKETEKIVGSDSKSTKYLLLNLATQILGPEQWLRLRHLPCT